MESPPTPVPASRAVTFFKRLTSTLFLWAVVLWALFSSWRDGADWVLLVLILVLVGKGLWEFYALVRAAQCPHYPVLGTSLGVMLVAVVFFLSSGRVKSTGAVSDWEAAMLGLMAVGICTRRFFSRGNESTLRSIAATLLGMVYVAFLFNFVLKVFFDPRIQGAWFVLFFVLVTKFSDAGAYAVGSLIGRHHMIPRISPGKTWEGTAGGIVVATGLGLALILVSGGRLDPLGWGHAVILGMLLSTAAVVGDLVESLLKREAGIKDSGRWFPGIGGVLDLLDSLLFNAPLMYLYLRVILPTH